MSHHPQRGTTLLLSLLLVVPLLTHAADGCKLNRLAVLPVTMDGLRPTVEAQINGSPALFTLDSGAFWSMLSPASAQQYALRLDYNRVRGLYVQGIGGSAGVAVTTVKTFTVFNVPFHNMDFIVGGSEPGRGTVGLLGQNILRIADVEYDLAQGSMALFTPENCKHVALVYWARAVGHAQTGHPRSSDTDLGKLQACLSELKSAGNLYWAAQVDVLFKEAQAWRSATDGDAEAAVLSLRTAADEEDAVEKLPVTPGPIVPAREQLGKLLLDLQRPDQALHEFQTALTFAPGSDAIENGSLS